MGQNSYVPFFNVRPDDEYPDGVEYPEDIVDDCYQVTTANINIFEPWPAHSVSRSNKRKRESGIIMDYERASTTKRNRVDCQ